MYSYLHLPMLKSFLVQGRKLNFSGLHSLMVIQNSLPDIMIGIKYQRPFCNNLLLLPSSITGVDLEKFLNSSLSVPITVRPLGRTLVWTEKYPKKQKTRKVFVKLSNFKFF